MPPLAKAALAGLLAFGLTVGLLRLAEWLYHRLRHTPDWSPHWGTWVFAVLAAVYAVASELGR
jgi:hypothetical protein